LRPLVRMQDDVLWTPLAECHFQWFEREARRVGTLERYLTAPERCADCEVGSSVCVC
jgi:hypothetical protein